MNPLGSGEPPAIPLAKGDGDDPFVVPLQKGD